MEIHLYQLYQLGQIPHDSSQGLVSVLHRNSKGEPSALASLHDTSREAQASTGPSDKWPVLAQHAESAALFLVRCFTLAVRESSSLVIRNLVSSPGGQSASRLSLCPVGRPPTMAGQTTECLSASVVYHEWMSLYSGHSSPWLEA
jgi:hypothetical protein